MSDLVKELEALDAKATKGPWMANRYGEQSDRRPVTIEWLADAGMCNGALWPQGEVLTIHRGDRREDNSDDWGSQMDDASVIVALRNALPALIEYVKAQDAVWEACEGAPIYAAKRLESAEAALLSALRGGK